ncbi:uncharacterized protein G2W53_020281 [Senna tora]|uniref:Uncharacterized protein n=1 Tax=Senna tora TaxID=362788 RepID=A0A834WND6_9FABA|nr:uncharacterized protein G2W53_020281 [Senna tora]
MGKGKRKQPGERVVHCRMEQQLQELQDELENLLWDQKELQEHLQIAVRERKERKMMESVLAELEEEHDMAIAKIVELESKIEQEFSALILVCHAQLQDLTNENRRLQEIQGKAYWSSKDQDQNISDYDNPHSALPWKSNYSGSGIALQNLIMTKDIWEDESKSKTEVLKLLKTGSKSGTCPPVRHETISREVKTREVVDHRRAAALSQSLFSALLSLLVGVTVWKAQEPCMPLVVALFTVVIMSLRSVVQFFSTIKNKPASDAVALLSLNWFVLGTLTYPTLPRFAHMFAPTLSSLLDQAISRLGGLFFS